MKKLLTIACMSVGLVFGVFADETKASVFEIEGKGVSWEELDFSDSKISLAGPSAILIRNVVYNKETYSFLVKADADGVWKIAETYKGSSDKGLPTKAVFDTATLSFTKENTVVIDGIMLDGKVVKSSLKVSNDGSLTLVNSLEPGTLVGSSLNRSKEIKKTYEDLVGNETLDAETLSKIGSLEESLKKLQSEKDAASNESALAKADLELTKTKLAELEKRNTSLNEEATNLKAQIETLDAKNKELAAKSNSNTSDAELEKSKARELALEKELSSLRQKADSLETEIASLKKQVADANAKPVDTDVAKLNARIDSLTKENEKLMGERNALEQKVRTELLQNGFIASMKPLLTKKVLSGFRGGKASLGTWKNDGVTLKQVDVKQFFSRFVLPLSQHEEPMLYSFTLTSTGTGLVGAGLHLFASDSNHKDYGNGESLLVWFTRDPDHYKNSNTYLQLYKSLNDYSMQRVLEGSIAEPIDKGLKVEILYQPKEEYITISVNGVEKIRYKTWFKVGLGLEVAFRTLDSAEFKDFTVTTTNEDEASKK